MANKAATFKQADVKRAVAGVASAGLTISRVEIDQNGKIVVIAEGQPTNDLPLDARFWKQVTSHPSPNWPYPPSLN